VVGKKERKAPSYTLGWVTTWRNKNEGKKVDLDIDLHPCSSGGEKKEKNTTFHSREGRRGKEKADTLKDPAPQRHRGQQPAAGGARKVKKENCCEKKKTLCRPLGRWEQETNSTAIGPASKGVQKKGKKEESKGRAGRDDSLHGPAASW